MSGRMDLSIVIPVHRDFASLLALLDDLASMDAEVVVVEAVSSAQSTLGAPGHLNLRDQCRQLVLQQGGQWLSSQASRGAQIALGCHKANHSWLWVLHADTRLIVSVTAYFQALCSGGQTGWGRFDICFREVHQRLELLALFMNWRSRWTQICTGDQGMFFHRHCLQQIGGFPSQPLMEDIEVSKLLKEKGGFVFHGASIRLQTSGRRWLKNGWLKTILQMWQFRLQYYFGKPAQALYDQYYKR